MLNLLVVDDHPSVLGTLDFVLASDRVRVLTAGCGAAALDTCRREAVDAALIDLHMPVMDGIALLQALKDHAAGTGRPLPVWLMTAAPTPGALEQSRQGGAEAMLKKPFDALAFKEALLSRMGGNPSSLASDAGGPREVLLFAGSGPPVG